MQGRVLNTAGTLSTLVDKETARQFPLWPRSFKGRPVGSPSWDRSRLARVPLLRVVAAGPSAATSSLHRVVTRLSFGVRTNHSPVHYSLSSMAKSGAASPRRAHTRAYGPPVPGLQLGVLRTQVKAMEDRAREKLGAFFEESWERNIFTRRFSRSAGPLYRRGTSRRRSPAERAEGNFSDITNPRHLPGPGRVQLPDRPDRYAGRRRSVPGPRRDHAAEFGGGRHFVVVVTARPPLSATDINLLRMLRGLTKTGSSSLSTRSMAEGGEEVLQEIGRQVASTLKREFPPLIFLSCSAVPLYAHRALNRLSARLDNDAERTRRGCGRLPMAQPGWHSR